MKKDKKYPTLNKIKGRITERGESYRSVSQKTGISLNSLSNKINGYSLFDLNEAANICAVLDIPQNEIANFFEIDVAKRNKLA